MSATLLDPLQLQAAQQKPGAQPLAGSAPAQTQLIDPLEINKPQAQAPPQPKQPAQPNEEDIKKKYGLPATANLSKEFLDDSNRDVRDPVAFSQAYQEMHPPKPRAPGFFSNVAQETKDIAKGMFAEPGGPVPSTDASGAIETSQSLKDAATSARQGKVGEAALHATEAVPVVGQPIAARIRQAQAGDTKGALGAALIDALMTALTARGMFEGAPEETSAAAPEAIRPEPRPELPAGAAARALPPAPGQRPAIPMPKQTPTVIPPSGETIAASGQPQAALPAGKTAPQLPPGPRAPREAIGEGLQSDIGPGEKPIPLPARTPKTIPPSEKPIAAGPTTIDPLELKKSMAKPTATPLNATRQAAPVAELTPAQQALDLKGQIKKLEDRNRELRYSSLKTRSYESATKNTAQQRTISAKLSDLRAQLEKIEPRTEAKPFTYPEGERIAPRTSATKQPTAERPAAKPEAAAPEPKQSKTPTYDRLPPEMREVVDSLATAHSHLPQMLREANEADMRKLSESGTSRKEQYARLVAKEAGIEPEPKNEGHSAVDFLSALSREGKPEARPLGVTPEAGISTEAIAKMNQPVSDQARLEGLDAETKTIQARLATGQGNAEDRRAAERRIEENKALADFFGERRQGERRGEPAGPHPAELRAVPARTAEKEPWQMTRHEWYDEKDKHNFSGAGSSKTNSKVSLANETNAHIAAKQRLNYGVKGEVGEYGPEPVDHRQVIEKALSEGKPVPANVLAEYPELLPARTADTMSDAIAISSPSGTMSKPARAAATERLGKELFGEKGLQRPQGPAPPTDAEYNLRRAKELRELAARGMKPKAYIAEAERLEEAAAGVLPGMTKAVTENRAAAGKFAGEQLTKETTQPLSDISERAGTMERESPLFRDTEASGQKGLFSGTRPIPDRVRELKRGISDGQTRLRSNVNSLGETLSDEEYAAVAGAVDQAKQELAEIESGPSKTPAGDSESLLGKGNTLHFGVDPTMVTDLHQKVNQLYREHVSDPAIEKLGMGRTRADVEAIDPKLASRMRRYDNAPLYFRTKAEDLVKHIVGNLNPQQERLFSLMADADSRENLAENHPKEYAQAVADKNVQAALGRYRPWEQQLTKARTILGGATLDRDYLRRIYTEHIAGVGKETKGQGTPRANFDRVITPQKESGPSRKATAEYHYEHGLHEFGPAFGTKFVGTMTKLAEHATAQEFLSKSTKIEPGDSLPPVITYNGEKFFRPDVAKMIREARPGDDSKAIARDLGVRELPAPKGAQPYEVYDPKTGKGGPEQPKYLGPRAIVDALHGLDKTSPEKGTFIGRFLREQIIGVGFGVPHVMNVMRRISQSFPMGSGNPVNWVRAVRVLTDSELKARALARTNDPTYDALMRWGGMSPHQIEGYKEYQGGNLNPANWMRVFAKVGHDYLFGPAGVDRRARLYVADMVKENRPDLTPEKVSQLVNDQLGRYNRATWTDLQKRVSRYMLFPGWDFASANWVLRHPIRTTVPPAMLIMLANQIIHHYGGNSDDDRFDPMAVHVGRHSYGLGLVNEPLARRIAAPIMAGTREALQGGTRRQVAAAAGREIPYAAGAPFGMTMPQVRLPVEIATNKSATGQDIVPRGDWTRRGTVLPSKGIEDVGKHALTTFFPQGQRIAEGRQNAGEVALSNFGINRSEEKPHGPRTPERVQDYYNVQDDIRGLDSQARAIAEDRSMTPEEKQRALEPIRRKYRELIKRDRPQ